MDFPVLRHILRIGLGEVLVVVNEVGIDIVAEDPRARMDSAHILFSSSQPRISLGSAIQPRMAVAIAVIGLIR